MVKLSSLLGNRNVWNPGKSPAIRQYGLPSPSRSQPSSRTALLWSGSCGPMIGTIASNWRATMIGLPYSPSAPSRLTRAIPDIQARHGGPSRNPAAPRASTRARPPM